MGRSEKRYKLQPSKDFGKYLAQLRKANTNLSQAKAARQIGLSPEQLNYYERGERAPHDATLIRLAQLYHISPEVVLAEAHWPQLVFLPLIAIIDPEQLSSLDYVKEIERGLEEKERKEITEHINNLLKKRVVVCSQQGHY